MSDKTVTQRLLIREGYAVAFVNAPINYSALLGALPKGVKVETKPTPRTGLIQVFVANQKELEAQLSKLKPLLNSKSIFWVSYLKGTSKTKTDVNRDSIHAYAKTLGLRGISMISIDDDWSAMRFKVV